MLSKAKIKFLLALQQKKQRIKLGLFVAEGEKIVQEILQQKLFKLHSIYATSRWINTNKGFLGGQVDLLHEISPADLKKISTLKTPNQVLAVLEIPQQTPSAHNIQQSFNLVLENIQDPGNLGTIIRIADWFGLPHIFCTKGCVEAYNPKVIQATMGSFLRIPVYQTELSSLFEAHPELPVYGAILGGENVYQSSLQGNSFLVIGNEGKGLEAATTQLLTQGLTIPKLGQAESLNAAVATGILCGLFTQSLSK